MSAKPTGEQIATHYESAHRRIDTLVRTLSPQQLDTAAPATPGWTVHDVVAHLAAITTDALAGRLQGMPSAEFTAGQVRDRRQASATDLLAEWAGNVPQMLDGARAGLVPWNLAVDALTHEQDIRGALGLPQALTGEELRFCTGLYAFGCGYALKQAGVPPLGLCATDSDFTATAGVGDPVVLVRAGEFDLFRALSGRRSRGQVAAFEWNGDSDAYLDRFNVFGPLPHADVVD